MNLCMVSIAIDIILKYLPEDIIESPRHQTYIMNPNQIARLITEDIKINNGLIFETHAWEEFWDLTDRANFLIPNIGHIHITDDQYTKIKDKIIKINSKIINLLPDNKNEMRKRLTNLNKMLLSKLVSSTANMERLEQELDPPRESNFATASMVEATISIRDICNSYLDLQTTIKNSINSVDVVANRRLEVYVLVIKIIIKSLTNLIHIQPSWPTTKPQEPDNVLDDVDVLPIPGQEGAAIERLRNIDKLLRPDD